MVAFVIQGECCDLWSRRCPTTTNDDFGLALFSGITCTKMDRYIFLCVSFHNSCFRRTHKVLPLLYFQRRRCSISSINAFRRYFRLTVGVIVSITFILPLYDVKIYYLFTRCSTRLIYDFLSIFKVINSIRTILTFVNSDSR